MNEESFLRYRLEVVQLMSEGARKSALMAAINCSLAALREVQNSGDSKLNRFERSPIHPNRGSWVIAPWSR